MIWRRVNGRYDLLPSAVYADDDVAVLGTVELIGDVWIPMLTGEQAGEKGYGTAGEAGAVLVAAVGEALAALTFPVEAVARGLSVAAVEVVAVDGACPVCGTEGVRLAQMGGVSACGACLTLALQAVT